MQCLNAVVKESEEKKQKKDELCATQHTAIVAAWQEGAWVLS